MSLLEDIEEPKILQIDRKSFHLSKTVAAIRLELLLRDKRNKLFFFFCKK